MPKSNSLTNFMLNLWPLLRYMPMRFFRKYLIRSVMLESQLWGEITDLSPSSLKISLSTSLIHFLGYSVFVRRPCILFNTWDAASLRSTSLFLLVRIVACDSLICLSYYSKTPI